MAGLLNNLMWNALEATLLALLVVVAARLCRITAPARHMLWFIVLLKLFVPPVAVHSIGLSGWCARAAERATDYAAKYDTDASAKPGPTIVPSDSILEPAEFNPTVELNPLATIGDEEKFDYEMSADVFVASETVELSVPVTAATDANQSVSESPVPATDEASPRGVLASARAASARCASADS